MKKLSSFPLAVVAKTSSAYNKSFHSKVFTLFASSESMMYRYAHRIKPSYTFCYTFLKDDYGQWFMDNDELLRVREWILKGARQGVGHVMKIYQMWQKDWTKFLKCSDRLRGFDLTKLSDRELYQELKIFHGRYLDAGSISYITDSFMSTGQEDWLEVLMQRELKRLKREGDFVEMVRLLTSPVHLSFTLQEELEVLKIAGQFAKKYSSLPKFVEVQTKMPALYKRLKAHERKFFWIRNNYSNVEYLGAEEIYEKVKKIICEARGRASDLDARYGTKVSELRAFRQKREKMLNTIALSKFHRNVLEIAKLFAKWKDVRKSGVYIGMHHYDQFLNEIARRRNMPKHDLTFAIFDEMRDILLKHKDFSGEIKARKQQTFFAVNTKGYYIVGGKKADPYFRYFKQGSSTEVLSVRGVSASPGKVTGPVHVIRKTDEMRAFKAGEILVTNQTTPEFMPIMRKAAAIVTEQGGITSHAAVISRELHKPCIIGTKIATHVLNNGDTVEVNANHGVVTVLKRA